MTPVGQAGGRSAVPPGVAAITGATGYLGSKLEAAFSAAGYQVLRLVRSVRPGTTDRAFNLGSAVDPATLDGVDILVHCAWDMTAISRTAIWETNVFGSVALLDAAVAAGVGSTVVVSSMSAYPGTRQLYGRAKLDVEQAALARGMRVVRPGLVYGPGWGGMAGTLRQLATLPLLPDFGPGAHQFTVHEDDMVAAILAVARTGTPPGVPVGIASDEAVPFRELVTDLALAQGQAAPRFVPVPPTAAFAALRTAEALGLPLPVRADSLLGLVRPAPEVANLDVLASLGVSLRPFDPRLGPTPDPGGDLDSGPGSDR
jgi:nucleoside-diphosphate-sugar epimerase